MIYLATAYILIAIVLVAYGGSLYRRLHQVKQTLGGEKEETQRVS